MNPSLTRDPHEIDRPNHWWKPALLMGTVLALFTAAVLLDAGQYIVRIRTWIGSLGAWGPAAFIAFYVVATIVALPGSVMSALAGGLFGAVWGVVYVSIGATIGAAVCFLISRHLARDAVSRWLEGRPAFEKLDRLTGTHGWAVVAIARFTPLIPYNVLNYGFGLTRVGFWPYLFWSWLGMLPGTVVYVVGTDAVLRALREGRVPWPLVATAAAGALVLLAVAYAFRNFAED